MNKIKKEIYLALEAAYSSGWSDRTSYHDQGTAYWCNSTRSEHSEALRKNKIDLFEILINKIATEKLDPIPPYWEKIDSAEDINNGGAELVLWDGCQFHIDYVDCEVDFGTSFFANGTEATHYLAGLTPPEPENDN